MSGFVTLCLRATQSAFHFCCCSLSPVHWLRHSVPKHLPALMPSEHIHRELDSCFSPSRKNFCPPLAFAFTASPSPSSTVILLSLDTLKQRGRGRGLCVCVCVCVCVWVCVCGGGVMQLSIMGLDTCVGAVLQSWAGGMSVSCVLQMVVLSNCTIHNIHGERKGVSPSGRLCLDHKRWLRTNSSNLHWPTGQF